MQNSIDLKLFDADAGTAQAQAVAQEGAGTPQTSDAPSASPQGEAGAETASTPEDKAKRFRALIRGEFREQYAEETQKLINRRFRETEALRRQLKELLERDGAAGAGSGSAEDGGTAHQSPAAAASPQDEDGTRKAGTPHQSASLTASPQGEAAARKAGTPHQSASLTASPQGEAAARKAEAHAFAAYQAARWAREAEALRAREPDFDLDAMRADPTFVLLLTHGVGLERAWRACTSEQRARAAAAAAEQAVLADIRARGARPSEAGGGVSAAAARSDVSRLSDAEVLDVLARLARRERVSFG